MVPFVERNYNMVELGPRGTGKTHLFQQVSPYAHLVSGGKATVARMFVNNANGQRGLVCQYDVVCFDEVSGVSFDQKDGVNIMKGYMESGEFSRGKESIRPTAASSWSATSTSTSQHQQRIGHLFGPLPPEMRNDTAFMDRIHCLPPGLGRAEAQHAICSPTTSAWSATSSPSAGASCGAEPRAASCRAACQFGGALSGRDTNAVQKTDERAAQAALPGSRDADSRRGPRVGGRGSRWSAAAGSRSSRSASAPPSSATRTSATTMGEDGVEQFVVTPELQSEDSIGDDPLPPGQVWAIVPGGQDENAGLFRIEVTEGPGTGVRILNQPPPAPFKESVRCAEQNLYVRAKELVGDRDPARTSSPSSCAPSMRPRAGRHWARRAAGALSALLGKSLKGGLVVVGGSTWAARSSRSTTHVIVEAAADKGAKSMLMPVATRKQLVDIPTRSRRG